jgi:hypothetical protein
VGECRKLLGPGQFIKDAAQADEKVETGYRCQWRLLGAQAGHPAEDVGIAAQLIGRTHFGMSGSEPGEELADGSAVVTVGARTERDSERVDGAAEGRGKPMS